MDSVRRVSAVEWKDSRIILDAVFKKDRMIHYARDFANVALSQAGTPYVWGAEASPTDPDPDAFDCSELVQWSLFRIGLPWVDGSNNQRNACANAKLLIPVPTAIKTVGALLFIGHPIHHVAISLGNGTTIEAKGRKWGTNIFSALGRFSEAGLVPGLEYSDKPHTAPPTRYPTEEETMNTFIVYPKDPTPGVGRTRGYRFVPQLRCVMAVNGAPLATKKHDDGGRAVVVIPAKYGELIGMGLAADKSGVVILKADDGTLDIPFEKPVVL